MVHFQFKGSALLILYMFYSWTARDSQDPREVYNILLLVGIKLKKGYLHCIQVEIAIRELSLDRVVITRI